MIEFSTLWGDFAAAFPIIAAIESTRYLIAAGLCSFILWVFWDVWFKARKLQARRAKAADYRREILTSLRTAFIFALIGFAMLLAGKAGVLTIYPDFSQRGPLYLVGTVAAMIVAHDAYFYWAHRAMHHPRLFRLFHATHHRSRTPTPWTAYSFDVGEAIVMLAFVPAWTAVTPMHDLGLFAFMTWQIVRNVMGHAGVELAPVSGRPSRLFGWLTTTLHHDLHHQDSRTNFGLYFTWWDRLMGTEHPAYQAQIAALKRREPPIGPAIRRVAVGAAVLAAAGAAFLASPARAGAPSVHDDWATEGFGAVVRLSPCASDSATLCGNLIWVWDPDRVKPGTVGELMLSNFRWDGDSWRGGALRNPEDGRLYRGEITPEWDVLRLRGCAGPFCRRQTWRRLRSIPRPDAPVE
jgi:sterol desaturase/sphingolipid hydroxylase (fatty acid hydroxylase superfamily)/uncharacterized protein (DUF2147 family)